MLEEAGSSFLSLFPSLSPMERQTVVSEMPFFSLYASYLEQPGNS